MARATKVIGVGSHHGDDRAGWEVAERLRRRANLGAEIVSVSDVSNLLHHFDDCDRLILIDACLSGDTPGTVKRLEWPDARIRSRGGTSTHGLGIADALELAEQLAQRPREIVLFAIEVDNCGPGESANGALEPGLEKLEACILAELARPSGD
jgi:hydrogenase maturation protease